MCIRDSRTILFATNISHSVHLAGELCRSGVVAEHLDGSTPTADRDAILRRLSDGITDVVCNVATGTETSLNDLAAALLRVMGSDLVPEYMEASKVNPVPRRLADTTSARDLLGFETRVGLDEGLSRLVDWWRVERDNLRTTPAETRS